MKYFQTVHIHLLDLLNYLGEAEGKEDRQTNGLHAGVSTQLLSTVRGFVTEPLNIRATLPSVGIFWAKCTRLACAELSFRRMIWKFSSFALCFDSDLLILFSGGLHFQWRF